MVDVGGVAPAGDAERMAGELCALLVDRLPVTGVSISVIGSAGQSAVGASDAIAARVEQLQFELGEGPHWVATSTALPVLLPDLRDADHSQWPVFGSMVPTTGAAALFAIPILMGAATVGVVDMYRLTAGTLDAAMVSRALALAALIGPTALRLAGSRPTDREGTDDGAGAGLRREVHQATGMVLAQLHTSATEAFARLQAYAFAHGESLEYVAREVVARRLDFRDEDDEPDG